MTASTEKTHAARAAGPPPRVSVLLPVHNGERFLVPAVESILRQSLTALELLVIDDGSTDRTPALLQSFKDSRVRVVRHDERQGLVRALNHAVSLARGEYLARQDADDISLPHRLKVQTEFLDMHPDVGFVGSAFIRIDATGARRRRADMPASDTEIRWQMLFDNAFAHPTVMLRSKLAETSPIYQERFEGAEDYDAWARLLRRTRAANLREPLVLYRVHEGSVSVRKAAQQRRLACDVSRRQLAQLPSGSNLSARDLEALRSWYWGIRDGGPCFKTLQLGLALLDEMSALDEVDRCELRRLHRERVERELLYLLRHPKAERRWRHTLVALALRDPRALLFLPRRVARAVARRVEGLTVRP